MRVALGVEYRGKNYSGWQRQKRFMGVQQKLEEALSKVANEPIEVVCAGRTDAGVNATGQVVHFDTNAIRKEVAWTLGVNTNLPNDIAVKWCMNVPNDFHARFSAIARRYRYIIYNGRLRPAILADGLCFYYHPLNAEHMNMAAQSLIGEHDFTSFRTVHCQAKTANRRIEYCHVSRHGNYVVVDIKANAFLHHMVRNIVGSLLRVGRGEAPIEWIAEVLAKKDRREACVTAVAEGLYFVDAIYPEEFSLPKGPLGPLFFGLEQ